MRAVSSRGLATALTAATPSSRRDILYRAKQSGESVVVLEMLASLGRLESKREYADAITALGRANLGEMAVSRLEEMSSVGLQPDVVCYTAAMSASGSWIKSLSLLEEMEKRGIRANLVTYNSAMRACERDGQWKKACSLLEEMVSRGVSPDATSYNTCIWACEKAGHWREALNLRERMTSEGIALDVFTYGALIAACDRGGQWEMALALLDEMKEPNLHCYGAAMSACARAGAHSQVFELMSSIQNPNVVIYTTAIKAVGDDWGRAIEIVETMKAKGIEPNSMTYNHALSACARAVRRYNYPHGAEAARLAAKKLIDEAPDELWCLEMYNAAMDASNADDALSMLDSMRVDPDVISFGTAISACRREGRWRESLHILYDRMPAARVEPNVIAYKQTIATCSRARKPREALRVLESMPWRDGGAYAAAISAIDTDWEAAFRLLTRMTEEISSLESSPRRPPPSYTTTPEDDPEHVVYAYNAVLGVCQRAEAWRPAVDLLRQMENTLEPDSVSYSCVVAALETVGEIELMKDVLRKGEVAVSLYSNAWLSESILDLTEKPVAVAKAFLRYAADDFLDFATSNRRRSITVVTGKSAVRQAIVRFIQEEYPSLALAEEESNYRRVVISLK